MREGRERESTLVLLVVVADKNGNAVIIALLIVARGTRGVGKCLFLIFFSPLFSVTKQVKTLLTRRCSSCWRIPCAQNDDDDN